MFMYFFYDVTWLHCIVAEKNCSKLFVNYNADRGSQTDELAYYKFS